MPKVCSCRALQAAHTAINSRAKTAALCKVAACRCHHSHHSQQSAASSSSCAAAAKSAAAQASHDTCFPDYRTGNADGCNVTACRCNHCHHFQQSAACSSSCAAAAKSAAAQASHNTCFPDYRTGNADGCNVTACRCNHHHHFQQCAKLWAQCLCLSASLC